MEAASEGVPQLTNFFGFVCIISTPDLGAHLLMSQAIDRALNLLS